MLLLTSLGISKQKILNIKTKTTCSQEVIYINKKKQVVSYTSFGDVNFNK